ncbi:hypothetical protein SAMN04489712_107306 [Thermomonospora echinospora]|uniref:Uncharacterized protein n=1 Tax=Thermomonospora echinospora TaxID=1992 RepID=A0A1H6BPH2_9ACTN|nr:hypothetical protein [Thermomonospora echinospora]SEG62580.1 hypothetical protein SAMN04489712_107306 [Thermomonospora echinospora]
MLTDNNPPADDHAAEVEALNRRYPRWTIWFGLATRRWWALPPREQDIGGFVEAVTPQRLIAGIEAHPAHPAGSDGRWPAPAHQVPYPDTQHVPHRPARHAARDSRQDVRRPSNLLRLEGVTPPPARRVPVVAWPGGVTR